MLRLVDATLLRTDPTDSAILRFAESLRPVSESQAEWVEEYKVNFSSKTKFMLKVCLLH
jgi:sodium/potassium-transporting ATPase subunit alpha